MKLRLSSRAAADIEKAVSWWHANREASPQLLEAELFDARHRLLLAPRIGVLVPRPKGEVRRLFLPRSRYWLIYKVVPDELLILRLWHASRGQQPRLGR